MRALTLSRIQINIFSDFYKYNMQRNNMHLFLSLCFHCNQQAAAVDVALMKRHIAIHHDPLDSSAAHVVVLAIIAAAICLREHHTIHRVAAGEGGGNPCRILLRERKAIHHHRLGSDGTGGHRTVLHSFRTSTILRPLGGSQAAFADKHRFTLDCGRKLRNDRFLFVQSGFSLELPPPQLRHACPTETHPCRANTPSLANQPYSRRLLCSSSLRFRIIAAPCGLSPQFAYRPSKIN